MARITKALVEKLKPASVDQFIWDDDIRGFGVRVKKSGARSFCIQYRTVEGLSRRLTVGQFPKLTVDEARREARLKLADATKGGDPAAERRAARQGITIKDLCAEYLAAAPTLLLRTGRPKKPSTLTMDQSRIDAHVIPLLGAKRVSRLASKDIERFQADIAAGKSAAQRKASGRGGVPTGGEGVASRTLGMLGAILQYAVKQGYRADNPVRGVTRFVSDSEPVFLTLDHVAQIGQALRAAEAEGELWQAIAAIRLLALTGFRRMEALPLRWSIIDLENGCVRFQDTKTGAQVRPIGRAAIALLRSLPRDPKSDFVFPGPALAGHFVGLPGVLGRVSARAELTGVTAHTFRHNFSSVAKTLEFSEFTIAGMLGHRLGGVTASYGQIPDKALRAAADQVADKIAKALSA